MALLLTSGIFSPAWTSRSYSFLRYSVAAELSARVTFFNSTPAPFSRGVFMFFDCGSFRIHSGRGISPVAFFEHPTCCGKEDALRKWNVFFCFERCFRLLLSRTSPCTITLLTGSVRPLRASGTPVIVDWSRTVEWSGDSPNTYARRFSHCTSDRVTCISLLSSSHPYPGCTGPDFFSSFLFQYHASFLLSLPPRTRE